MTCVYKYKGKTYSESEFKDILKSMLPKEAATFMPNIRAIDKPVDLSGKQIGWLRMDTRDGGLFIEELQSQRAQQGRSKGFSREVDQWFIAYKNGPTVGDGYNSEQEAQAELADTFGKRDDMEIRPGERDRSTKMIGVPPAPFVSDANNKATNAYITLLMKKALIEAVSNAHDSVSWTTGEQQADRYDLSKQIDRVETRRGDDGLYTITTYDNEGEQSFRKHDVHDQDLPDIVGKDLAKKISEREDARGMYYGLDLKVGGEWAQSMYGNEQGLNLQGKPSLMTQAANDIFKHVGSGKVESINGQPGFYVTPEMKSKDLPLFSRSTVTVDGIERPTTNSEGKPINNPVNFWKWFGDSKVVDKQGRPRVFYHGGKSSEDAIDTFQYKFTGSRTDSGWMGRGFYFGDSRTANVYAGHDELNPEHFPTNGTVYPVYLSLKNPAILIDSEKNDGARTLSRELVDLPDEASADEVRAKILEQGYDGVIYQRTFSDRSYIEILAFDPNQIKSAIGNNGDYSKTNSDIRFSFAGPKAETADKYALDTAQQRLAAGEDADKVRQATGWFKGVDDKWRFEINDSDASIKKPFPTKNQSFGDVHKIVYTQRLKNGYPGISLGDILDHPKLFAAYPNLVDLSVDTQKGDGASFRVSTSLSPSMIQVGENVPMSEVLSVLLHEIQHGIQRTEGFATGGSESSAATLIRDNERKRDAYVNSDAYKEWSKEQQELIENTDDESTLQVALEKHAKKRPPSDYVYIDALDTPRSIYAKLAGEVEARNTQKRIGMTDDDRREVSPRITQDTYDKDQIIVYNGVEMRSEPEEKKFDSNRDIPETRFRKFQRMNQDSFNRFTVIREWLEKNGHTLSDMADVYGAEERYHSKVANQLEDFREFERNPLIEKIQKAGYTLGDIEVFLKMQHTQEANAQNRKITGNPDTMAAGITDEEAAEYLAEAPKELATLANELRDITEQTKQLRLDAGILNTDITGGWEGAYKYYIPMKGEADAERGTGKGLSVNFKSKRRLGHGLRDEHVIENIFMDHERAIMEVEKNRVGKSLVMMGAEMQRPDIISIAEPEKRKVLKTDTAYVVEANGVTQGVFATQGEAKIFKQLYAASMPNVAPSAIVISQTKDQRVIATASPMLADNEINVYMNGHAIRVQINDELLARAYTKLGVEQFTGIIAAGRMLNGYLSKVYTGYNPEFIVTNMERDFQSGLINLTGEQGITMATKALVNYPKMFSDLLKYAASNGKSSTKLIDSYRANGGNTGAAYLSDMERLGNEVATEYAAYQGVMANLKQGDTMNAARAAGKKLFKYTLKWIYNFNQAGENAMRLAAYKAMLDSGRTVNEAAKVAKNITVNFNRKGERKWTPALYLFFNATIQGTAAVSHALLKGKHKYQAQALAAGMAAVGYMVGAALGGGDEDDWKKINEYNKERNVLIKSGDGYVKIPLPYGHAFFYNLGRHIAEAQRTGEWGVVPWHLATSAISEFTPLNDTIAGSDTQFESEQVFMGVFPTAAKIIAQPIFNENLLTGAEVMPDSEFDKSQPDREKMWRGTKGTMYDKVAGWLEAAGFDVSPETLKYTTRTFTGGAGALVDTAISSAMLKKEGATLDAAEIPFVRKGYMELGVKDARAAFHKAAGEARTAAETFNRIKRKNDLEKLDTFLADGQNLELLALDNYADKLRKWTAAERDIQDALRADESISVKEKRLKLKELEKQETQYYDDYLDLFKASKQ